MFLSQKVRKLLLKVAGNIFFQYLTFSLDNSTPFLFLILGSFHQLRLEHVMMIRPTGPATISETRN